MLNRDFWNNNMMFLMDKNTGKIRHQILIDLQVKYKSFKHIVYNVQKNYMNYLCI